MADISATDAARSFSDLLDGVEHRGESYTIVRRGKAVATLAPVGQGTGREVKALMAKLQADPAWIEDLAAMRSLLETDTRP
jgi:prevent-host-death family protein